MPFKSDSRAQDIIVRLLPFADVVLAPLVFPAAILLKVIRKQGVHRMPLSKRILLRVGIFPIRNHYYEPLFDGRLLRFPMDRDRVLPGIDWNVQGQREFLKSFHHSGELNDLPDSKVDDLTFYISNTAFGGGDAEYWYNLIRLKKPSRIFEIGSGHSTLMAQKAISKNKEESPGYACKHLCIEPFEMPWLEKLDVTVIRQRVEDVDKSLFSELGKDDILFIDSSHIIRPQGDVLFEYLELLPVLRAGVIVHVHDIFSPREYPKELVMDEVKFWNEQYLLEAFLTSNHEWRIVGALNYLCHHYFDELGAKCPYLSRGGEPGSFYFQKVV